MLLVPSLPLVEVMYFMPSAPLICCSSGIVTALSTVCALAPIYEAGHADLRRSQIGKLRDG